MFDCLWSLQSLSQSEGSLYEPTPTTFSGGFPATGLSVAAEAKKFAKSYGFEVENGA